MPRKLELKGKRYGKLVVTREAPRRKNSSSIYWMCICDCGNTKDIRGSDLCRKNKPTRSCGCLQKEVASKQCIGGRLPEGKAAFNALYQRYKNNAKSRNIKFLLSKVEANKLFVDNCYYCGIEPRQFARGKTYWSPFVYNGIDRLNNDLDYMLDNCVTCCWQCNKAKHTMTVDEFKSWILRVYSNVTKL